MGSNVIGTGLWGNTLWGGGTPSPTPGFTLTIEEGILYVALRIAGVLNAARRTASNEEIQDTYCALNALIDGYETERLMIYAIQRNVQTMVAGQQDYQIGSGSPDWDVPRPVRIENASLLYLQTEQVLELPMQPLTVE